MERQIEKSVGLAILNQHKLIASLSSSVRDKGLCCVKNALLNFLVLKQLIFHGKT